MKLAYSLLAAGLLAIPAAAQPVLIPLTPQKQTEPPPAPAPSPVPVAPPQAGIRGAPEGTGAPVAGADDQRRAPQEPDEGTARAPDR